MRTTLTIDEDVALLLERARKDSGLGFKQLVNKALRLGLQHLEQDRPPKKRRAFTKPSQAGACRVPLTSVSEALALAEGDDYR